MKKLLLLLALLLPVMASAMKIEKDEMDEFTGKRTVITSWEKVCTEKLQFRFRLQNDVQWMDVRICNSEVFSVPEGAKLMLKSTAGNIGEFSSIAFVLSEPNGKQMFSDYRQIAFVTYTGDLSYFKNNVTTLARVNFQSTYIDRKISEGDGKKLQKLYDLFNTTITGEQGTVAYANYTIKFMKRKLPNGSWDLVKEEYKKDLSSDEVNAIMNEWKAQTTDKVEFGCQLKKEK